MQILKINFKGFSGNSTRPAALLCSMSAARSCILPLTLALTLFALQAPAQAQQAEGFFERRSERFPKDRIQAIKQLPAGVFEGFAGASFSGLMYGWKGRPLLTIKDVERLKRNGVAVVDLNHPQFNSVWQEYAPAEYDNLRRAEGAHAAAVTSVHYYNREDMDPKLRRILENAKKNLDYSRKALNARIAELREPGFWETSAGKTMSLRLTEVAKKAEMSARRVRVYSGIVGLYTISDGAYRWVIARSGRDPGAFPIWTAITDAEE
jgi:hypothetical protein